MTLPIAVEYAEYISQSGKPVKYAAAFILFGALVIGGGAMMEPRVRKNFGCGDLYKYVIGPNRAGRREEFIEKFDAVASADQELFNKIVKEAEICMGYNNKMLSAMQRRPYWYYPTIVVALGVAVSFGVLVVKQIQKQS